MDERELSSIDRLLVGLNQAIAAVAAAAPRTARSNPAKDVPESALSAKDKAHSAGLMRVNHAGEIAAQGLYQGHAAVSRDPALAKTMRKAAEEELDHLNWCEQRLSELGSRPSSLSPVWYAGAFAMGAASGLFGDRWSLGFVQETERQVSEHLTGHLARLPENDQKSRTIVSQMREEEEQHGANAKAAGAADLPRPIRKLMRLTAGVMTRTAYWM